MALRAVLVAAFVVSSSGLATPLAQAETWKFALEEIDGSVQDAYAEKFKELVENRTDGEVTVQVYPYGTLGTSAQLTELVLNGTLQFANASPDSLGSLVPEVNVFNLPYILSQSDEVNKKVLTEGEAVNNILAPKLAEKGLHLITMYPEGDMVWTTNKEVRSPEDFSGFKMRTMTSPILTESYKAMGANPTPMPYGEVYGALQLKQIDGQVNPVFAIEEMKFYEVSDYMIWAGQQELTTTVVANQFFWKNLPDDRKQMVNQVSTELVDYIFDVKQQYAEERLAKIKEAKPDMPMIELSEDEKLRFAYAAQSAFSSLLDSLGPDARKLFSAVSEDKCEGCDETDACPQSAYATCNCENGICPQ